MRKVFVSHVGVILMDYVSCRRIFLDAFKRHFSPVVSCMRDILGLTLERHLSFQGLRLRDIYLRIVRSRHCPGYIVLIPGLDEYSLSAGIAQVVFRISFIGSMVRLLFVDI